MPISCYVTHHRDLRNNFNFSQTLVIKTCVSRHHYLPDTKLTVGQQLICTQCNTLYIYIIHEKCNEVTRRLIGHIRTYTSRTTWRPYKAYKHTSLTKRAIKSHRVIKRCRWYSFLNRFLRATSKYGSWIYCIPNRKGHRCEWIQGSHHRRKRNHSNCVHGRILEKR